MSARLFVYAPGSCWTHPLEEGHHAGRSRSAGITLRDETLGRRHVLFELRDGVWFARDMASTNATWVDGVELYQEEAPLREGSQIEIGRSRLVFSEQAPRGWLVDPARPHRQVPFGARLAFRSPILHWLRDADGIEWREDAHWRRDRRLEEGDRVPVGEGAFEYRRSLERRRSYGRREEALLRLLDADEAARAQGLALLDSLDVVPQVPFEVQEREGVVRVEPRSPDRTWGERVLAMRTFAATPEAARVETLALSVVSHVAWSTARAEPMGPEPRPLLTAPLRDMRALRQLYLDGWGPPLGPRLPQVRHVFARTFRTFEERFLEHFPNAEVHHGGKRHSAP